MALGWSSPSLSLSLLSSATRSSLFTILLLQPVFFLRSRPTRESVREVMVKVIWVDFGVRGPLQELALGRLTLNRRAHRWQVRPTTGGHASPRPPTCYVLLLLPMSKSAECCRKDNCCCNFKCFGAAGPALGGSSQAPPPSSCDLLRPGLL